MAGEPLRPSSTRTISGRRSSSAREYTQRLAASVQALQYQKLAVEEEGAGRQVSYLERLFMRWKAGAFTIIPEHNPYMDVWDVVTILALLSTASVLPYEVALVDKPGFFLRVVNMIVDVIFIADVIVTFNVAHAVSNTMSKDSYEREPFKIMQHYMAIPFSENFRAGWFWPDMVTIIPWEMLVRQESGGFNVRLARILRLLRMFRLARVIKLFNRWHASFGFSFAFFSLLKCLAVVMLALHWLACLWGYIAMIGANQMAEQTWLTVRSEFENRDPHSYSHVEIYNLALYYSTMTLTSVGYGDIRPANDEEVALATFMMISTGFTWAFVLATTVHIVSNMDTYSSRFRDRMDELNLLMDSRGLNPKLRRRLRKYMHESFHVNRQRHQRETINLLSPGLQGEVAMESGLDKVCDQIWYLRNVNQHVMVTLAGFFVPEMYSPNEFLQDKSKLLVIRHGSAISRARIMTRDKVIHEDMILTADFLRDSATPRTLSFLEVAALSCADLFRVCEQHPAFSRRIRKAQMKLAIWRGVIYAARQVKIKGSKWEQYWRAFCEEEDRKARKAVLGGKRGGDSESLGGDVEQSLAQLLQEMRRVGDLSEQGVQRIAHLERRLGAMEARIGLAHTHTRSSLVPIAQVLPWDDDRGAADKPPQGDTPPRHSVAARQPPPAPPQSPGKQQGSRQSAAAATPPQSPASPAAHRMARALLPAADRVPTLAAAPTTASFLRRNLGAGG